jgi:hypothetical protein
MSCANVAAALPISPARLGQYDFSKVQTQHILRVNGLLIPQMSATRGRI